MIKHLFKLIWNKKKQNFLMIIEMFVSFLVIFAVQFVVFELHIIVRQFELVTMCTEFRR